MKALTIGILAHIDAGKTSLTERLLFETGVIDHAYWVDDGDTQTDSLDLERRRGITIKSAVVAVSTPGHRLSLVDTPGHPDFIAEVERAVGVLDGAVLVVSAVEGVQAQTRVLMRTLVRLSIPVLVFVNKIDRTGARAASLLDSLRTKLSPQCVAVSTVTGIGTASAHPTPLPFDERLADALAGDDAFVESYVAGTASSMDYRKALVRQVAAASVYPVFFGSAVTGAGVRDLIAGVYELLPSRERRGDGPLDATVFKIERGRSGEKIAYVRMFSGSLAARRPVPFRRSGTEGIGRPTAVRVFEHGATPVSGEALAGDVARVWGLPEIRIGDRLGERADLSQDRFFAPPSLETLVYPVDPDQTSALYTALTRLSEQDPLISIRFYRTGKSPSACTAKCRKKSSGQPSPKSSASPPNSRNRDHCWSNVYTGLDTACAAPLQTNACSSGPPSDSASNPARPAPAPTTGWKSNSAHCRFPSTLPSRTPSTRSCTRVCTAGK